MMGDTLRTSVVANVIKPNMNEAFFMARDLAPDHPDVVSGRRFRSANQWPECLPGFREALVEYCDALERLVQRLVRVYARALDLPATYFDGPFTDFQYKLRATHYPLQPKAPDDEFGIAPSMAGSCCCAGPTIVSSQRPHCAVNRTGGERYALAFFCDAQIDWPIAAVPTCVGPGRPPRYETTYYTGYMICYQARTYNVFGDQAKDAAE
jgi:isopenicillin N synthase-like dioxygenase